MAKHLEANLLAELAQIKEVDIETKSADRRPHRRTIWVVVIGNDAYIRSYRGSRGVWYRQIRANPDATLYLGSARIPVRAIPVRAERTIAQVSAEYLRKYKGSRSAQAMVEATTLPTTLRLTPR